MNHYTKSSNPSRQGTNIRKGINLEDKDNGNYVKLTELTCNECGYKETREFPRKGILYGDYIHEIADLKCPECRGKFSDDPNYLVNTRFFDSGNGNDNGHDKSNSKPNARIGETGVRRAEICKKQVTEKDIEFVLDYDM